MRLTQKKIEDILMTIIGEESLPLIRELEVKNNISEFDLASKTKKDIKIIRKWLYLLHNHNLVSFTRKKDKQKGWYIYYWTLSPESIRFSYYKMKRELLDSLKKELEEEQKELFYVCPEKCTRLNFDQALSFEFHCPECGKLAEQDNRSEKVAILQKKIKEVEEDISTLTGQREVRRKVVKDKRKTAKKKAVKRLKIKARKKIVTKKRLKKETIQKTGTKHKSTSKKTGKKSIRKKIFRKIVNKIKKRELDYV